MFRHILVPTDDSELSRHAARQAITLAKELGAQITAFYAKPEIHPENEGDLLEPTASDRLAKGSDKKAKEYLGFIKKLGKDAGVECRMLEVVNDKASDAIIDAALDGKCDLIFMASHGRRGLQSLLLGSQTLNVLTHSSIPVLVYRPHEIQKRHHR